MAVQTTYATAPATKALAPGLYLEHIGLEIPDGQGTRQLLKDVNLQVSPGEVLGITGPSGSGKSTLLAVAGTLQAPTVGKAYLVAGNEGGETATWKLSGLGAQQAAKMRRDHIGIVFQQPNLMPSLNVGDQLCAMVHLSSPWPIGRKRHARAVERSKMLLDAVGLPGFDKRKISELSGGQQARVNIARALMNKPELLLVDEPTAALDTATGTQITKLIVDMAQQFDAATLYVSHDQDQLARLDRLAVLVDGEITSSL